MSIVVNFLKQLNAIELSIAMFVAFLLFYTMYDKKKKALVPGILIGIIMFSDGISKSLGKYNKALSFSGLSTLCLAFIPIFSKEQNGLLWSATLQLLIHSAYSAFTFYGSKHIPYLTSFINITDQSFKKISIILGSLAQLVLFANMFNYLALPMVACFGIIFGLAHFYFMVVDHKMILRIRPFAYIVFPLSVLGILYGCFLK